MTTTPSKHTTAIGYVAPPGSGLGFSVAGIDVLEAATPADALARIKEAKVSRQYSILFVDEGLAVEVVADIERLNADTIPAIVLLPNPAHPQNLTQETMNNLVIQAVGSDIFST